MKTIKRITVSIFLLVVASRTSLCAPIKENNFTFTTEPEMKAVVAKNATNLRASYYIILRARKIGLEEQTALAYHSLKKPSLYDHRLMATFAFAYYTATDPWHDSGPARLKPRSARYPQLVKLENEAWADREDSLKKLSDKPEVLVMSGIAYATNSSDGFISVGLFRKAVQLDPKWGHAHYWLGHKAVDYSITHPSMQKAFAEEGVRELLKSEKLDPTLHHQCLGGLVYAYAALKDDEKTLHYIDAYFADNASADEKARLLDWRNKIAKKLGRPQI